jgi:hypothetical protein
MAVAASEVVVGLGLVVALNRKRVDARRRPAQHPARLMVAAPGSACCRRSRRPADHARRHAPLARAAGYLATASCFVAFGGARRVVHRLLGRDGSSERSVSTAWTWITGGSYQSGLRS